MNKNHIAFTILNFFLLANGMEEQESPSLNLQQEVEKILSIIANDPSATPPTGDDFEIKYRENGNNIIIPLTNYMEKNLNNFSPATKIYLLALLRDKTDLSSFAQRAIVNSFLIYKNIKIKRKTFGHPIIQYVLPNLIGSILCCKQEPYCTEGSLELKTIAHAEKWLFQIAVLGATKFRYIENKKEYKYVGIFLEEVYKASNKEIIYIKLPFDTLNIQKASFFKQEGLITDSIESIKDNYLLNSLNEKSGIQVTIEPYYNNTNDENTPKKIEHLGLTIINNTEDEKSKCAIQ